MPVPATCAYTGFLYIGAVFFMSAEVLGPITAGSARALPLFSEVSCGFPSPAEPYAEKRLSLDELVRVREPSMFMVRAMGDSMIGAGIYPGDVIVVDRAREARSGDIVVACMDNAFTVKRLRLASGRVTLEPANPDYAPHVLQEGEDLMVWGVCTWNLHRLSPA